MAFLEVRDIHKDYEGAPLLCGVDFDVERGDIASLLGPSGSGKTTLLRIIAGLERPKRGRVFLEGEPLAGVPVHRRGIVLMFQEYALFPHKSVAENVAFGLRMRPSQGASTSQRVTEVLDLVGLGGVGERDVNELSGGERQRVALARSLAPSPRLLLLDEPLGALDRNLRERLMEELPVILHEVGVTALTVTHDQEEAFALADHVILLHDGRVVQAGRPEEVYRAPADAWTARFLGVTNLVDAIVTAQEPPQVRTAFGILDLTEEVPLPEPGTEGTLLIHPWGIHLTNDGSAAEATVTRRTFHGARYRLTVDAGGIELEFSLDLSHAIPEVKKQTHFRIDPAALRWI
jgi:ABC-type Fe3+/spermidine/putrescine transport system ATPase subunit